MTTNPKTRKTPAQRGTPDKASRSRRYQISRLRNILIHAKNEIGKLGILPEDLIQIEREVFLVYKNIGGLIEALNAAASANLARQDPCAKQVRS